MDAPLHVQGWRQDVPCSALATSVATSVPGGRADRALEYLARAITPSSRAKDWSDRCWVETTIADFNDNCAGYGEIERVLRGAQELARADITVMSGQVCDQCALSAI